MDVLVMEDSSGGLWIGSYGKIDRDGKVGPGEFWRGRLRQLSLGR